MTFLALSLVLAGACSGSAQPQVANPQRTGLQIKLVTVYVNDQDKALRFYTDVLGFAKKDDFTNGPYRWLSVTDARGNELQLALEPGGQGVPAGTVPAESARDHVLHG